MSLKERLSGDFKDALREKNQEKLGVLRLVLNAVKQKELEKRASSPEGNLELSEQELIAVLNSEAKKRKEASQQFETGGRNELAAKERAELEIIQQYLPQQLSNEEVKKMVQEAIISTGATSIQQVGQVIGEVIKRGQGRVDGSLVSTFVKEELNKLSANKD